MRLSRVEGALWALMVGFSETYFVADAVRLGASPVEQGLVMTLPLFLGGIGSLLAVAGLTRVSRRKTVAVSAVVLQALVLGAIALVESLHLMTPVLLIAAACAYQMSGQAAGIAWSSWFGDLVPADVRGRYFSRRAVLVTVATSAGLATAGMLLQVLEPGPAGTVVRQVGGQGFRLIYVLGVLFRLLSALMLIKSPEPVFRGIADRATTVRFFKSHRGHVARRLMLTGALFHLSVYLASSYFGPYMLSELKFAYWEYTTAMLCAVAFKMLLLPLWGERIDRHGARSVFVLAARMVALVPLPWLVAQGLPVVVVAQCFSGASWSGYEVSFFSLMLETSTSRARPYVFAAYNFLGGTAQLLGTVCGASLLGLPGWTIPRLFMASLVGRVTVGLFLPRIVPAIDRYKRPGALRMAGMRPGGVAHQPVDRPATDDPGPAGRGSSN
jgi:hypothetical protein